MVYAVETRATTTLFPFCTAVHGQSSDLQPFVEDLAQPRFTHPEPLGFTERLLFHP